jgi:hypothetical protein
MSDNAPAADAATDLLRARIDALNAEIADHTRAADTAALIRDEIEGLLAALARKARPRKPRVVEAAEPPAAPAFPLTFNPPEAA